MNIKQHRTQLFELRDSHGISAHSAVILAVGANFPAYYYLILRLKIVFLKPFCRGIGFENSRYDAVFRSAAYKLAAGTRTENSAERIYDYRFARARFTGQDSQPPAELDISFFNDSNIFNMQLSKHVKPL